MYAAQLALSVRDDTKQGVKVVVLQWIWAERFWRRKTNSGTEDESPAKRLMADVRIASYEHRPD